MATYQKIVGYDYQPVLATMQPGQVYTTAQLAQQSSLVAKEALMRLHTAFSDGKVSKRVADRSGGTYEWELRLG